MMDMNEQARELSTTGTLVLTDPNGKRLFFATSKVFEGKGLKPGVLIAYETYGSIYWDGEKDLTKFVLFQHGFSALVAPIVLSVVRAILGNNTGEDLCPAIEDRRADTDNV